jgi:hypothetical protein
MGRLPEAWIAPPATRELRGWVRHRAKLVAVRELLSSEDTRLLPVGQIDETDEEQGKSIGVILAELDDQERDEVLQRAEHIRELLTGYRPATPNSHDPTNHESSTTHAVHCSAGTRQRLTSSMLAQEPCNGGCKHSARAVRPAWPKVPPTARSASIRVGWKPRLRSWLNTPISLDPPEAPSSTGRTRG